MPPAVSRTRLATAAVVIGLAIVLIAGLLLLRGVPSASPAGRTVWQAITSGIDGEDMPVATALQAFAYLTGVDIPEVTIPAGVPGDDTPTSATGALRWVRAHWPEVTEKQRAPIEAFLHGGPGDVVVPVTGPAGEPVASTDRVASLAAGPPAGVAPIGIDAPTDTIAEAIKADVLATLAHIGPKLGLAQIHEGLFLKDVSLVLSDQDDGNVFWLTQPVLDGGHYSPCNLTVYKNLWSKESAGQPLSATMHVTLTHEVVHCYQYAVIDDVYVADQMPKWIMEGSAIWLAGNDTGIVEPMTPGLWRRQIMGSPETALTNRTYDAYGWYALLDHLGRPLWGTIADAWRAAARAAGTQRSEAFIAVLDGDAEDVTHAWAPAHAREPSWSDPWLTYGLGLPDNAVAQRRPVVATGAGFTSSLPSRANTLDTVTRSEGEIVVVETDGLASVHDGTMRSSLAFTSRRFCVEGDCICPPRTQRAGEHMADEEMWLPFIVAFQSPAGGAGQRISSRKLETECGKADSPPPSSSARATRPPTPGGHGPPRCGRRCPGSNGDPHLVTVDGTSYDFQAAGEFTLVRTPDGTVDVEARQEPAPRSEFGRVSNNTAIAARVGDRRVAVYSTTGGLEVRIDGVIFTGDQPMDVGGGRVARYPRGVEIELPDGTVVWALPLGFSGISVLIDPSPALVAAGEGLLGRSAPGWGLPRLPDGTALAKPLDRHEAYRLLYGQFADAWRVTATTSLFDYDAGKTTADYTIRDYPAAPKVATFQELDPATAAAGSAACQPIEDALLREQCAFDVAVTGDASYVDGYVIIGRVADLGTVALDVPIGPVETPGPGGSPRAGEAGPPVEVMPVVHRLAGSALSPNGTLYVSVVLAGGSGQVLAIDPRTGVILRTAATTGAGEVAVAAGSVWVAEFGGPSGGGPACAVTRLDPATLAVQATIPTACQGLGLGTELAAMHGDVWYVDPTGADPSGTGGSLRRIDGATNTVAGAVVVPFTGGSLRASATALFYGDPPRGQFRLRPGDTALSRLGLPGTAFLPNGWPADDGLWAVSDGALGLFTAATGPSGTIDLGDADGGSLVGADGESVFIERSASAGGGRELWRRFLDGRAPLRLASAGTVQTGAAAADLLYADVTTSPFLVGRSVIAKVWLVISRADPNESLLLVQGARLDR